jgi:hypothetical protein
MASVTIRDLDDDVGIGTRIRRRFAGADIDDLELPPRDEMPRAPELG